MRTGRLNFTQRPAFWLQTGILSVALLSGFLLLRVNVGNQPLSMTDWSSRDVGQTQLRGGVVIDGRGTVLIRGAGTDIWDAADGFHFFHTVLEGDGQVVARVLGVTRTDRWAKAGLMFREDLTPDSPHAAVVMTPSQGAAFLRRHSRGGQTVDDAHQAMRLVPGCQRRNESGENVAV